MEALCIPTNLVCEFLTNPLGIGEVKPRLSWKLSDTRQGAKQTAYQIVAATSLEKLETKPDLWKTSWVKSDQCLDIEWAGKALKSRMKVFWKVQVKDLRGKESSWSEVATFEMGILKKTEWSAQWISDGQPKPGPSPYFRKPFTLNDSPVSARLYITARGLFEASINGRKVGHDFFTPGWTEYQKRIHSLTYDVTEYLQSGDNVIGVVLGEGWFSGRLGWNNDRNIWGDTLSFLAELEVSFADGSVFKTVSDLDWKVNYGAIRSSDLYDGEVVDLRLRLNNWDRPYYDDHSWQEVVAVEKPKAEILPKPNAPIKEQENLPVIQQTEPLFGVHIFDLGQNIVGFARVKLFGQHDGDVVTVRYGEMLQEDGSLYTKNLRSAECTDFIYCNGDHEIWFEPKFTYHGFRYIELTGLRRKPEMSEVTGVVLHSEIPATGKFECSEPLVNRLQQNIVWGQKGNFFETPTDCPQRDERLGWTGDAQVFARTASFNCDVAAFFEKYCEDMEDAQLSDGRVSCVAPNPLQDEKIENATKAGQAAWADAVVVIPWVNYLTYGNKRILEQRYDSMQKFVEWRIRTAKGFIHQSAVFGDWLAIDAPASKIIGATSKDLIATAYFAHSTHLLAKISNVLGKKKEAKKYLDLFEKIKEAFNQEFVTSNGRVASDTQTAYLLAIGFELLPSSLVEAAGKNLVKVIEQWKGHLSTGFVGTPLIAPVLTSIGRIDLAYKLLLNQTYPSWLFSVLQGATTVWERWNSYSKQNGFGDHSMNSFNHYAYGAIGEWLVSTVAGLNYEEKQPGYKHLVVKPLYYEGLTSARAELETRYGKAISSWRLEGHHFYLEVDVPPNTKATVYVPTQAPVVCTAGHYEFSVEIPKEAVVVEKSSVNKSKKVKAKAKTKAKPKIEVKNPIKAEEKIEEKAKAKAKLKPKAAKKMPKCRTQL